MRAADPSVRLTVWGDGPNEEWQQRYQEGKLNYWAQTICDAVGDSAELVAFHNHFGVGDKYNHLQFNNYRKDFDLTYQLLLDGVKDFEDRIDYMRLSLKGYPQKIAMTEGHFILDGRNRNEVLSSWAVGVAYARCLNTIMRHSDVLDIATMADFFGNVWQVNAIIIPGALKWQRFKPYLQPIGSVMALFKKHQGEFALDVSYSGNVDAVASVTNNKIFIRK